MAPGLLVAYRPRLVSRKHSLSINACWFSFTGDDLRRDRRWAPICCICCTPARRALLLQLWIVGGHCGAFEFPGIYRYLQPNLDLGLLPEPQGRALWLAHPFIVILSSILRHTSCCLKTPILRTSLPPLLPQPIILHSPSTILACFPNPLSCTILPQSWPTTGITSIFSICIISCHHTEAFFLICNISSSSAIWMSWAVV